MRVSSAGFTQFFRLGVWQKLQNCPKQRMGRRNTFSPSAKIALMVLKAYTGFSNRHLVEHLNGNIHYQMFCGIIINPSFPITNYKIVSVICSSIRYKSSVVLFYEAGCTMCYI